MPRGVQVFGMGDIRSTPQGAKEAHISVNNSPPGCIIAGHVLIDSERARAPKAARTRLCENTTGSFTASSVYSSYGTPTAASHSQHVGKHAQNNVQGTDGHEGGRPHPSGHGNMLIRV